MCLVGGNFRVMEQKKEEIVRKQENQEKAILPWAEMFGYMGNVVLFIYLILMTVGPILVHIVCFEY